MHPRCVHRGLQCQLLTPKEGGIIMSFQRELYEKYLAATGRHNPSPYCSSLDKIEKLTNTDIDREYDSDQCKGLLRTLLELRGNASDDAK